MQLTRKQASIIFVMLFYFSLVTWSVIGTVNSALPIGVHGGYATNRLLVCSNRRPPRLAIAGYNYDGCDDKHRSVLVYLH